ncbi:MAG: glycosyltransferase family 1 protein [Nitrospiraceae bacterium]|nr:glycosyltransferase family 1 protein [Nitrospiraceae bacterium]
MKIAVNASFLNERPTGVGVFTRQVSSALSSLCAETYVFSSVPIPGVDPGHVIRTPRAVRGSVRLLNNVARLIHDNTVIPLLVRRHGIDVLFCPIAEFPIAPPVRMVVTVHDLHPLYYPGQFGVSSAYYGFSLRRLSRAACRVVTVSEFVKKEICARTSMSADRVDVVPNGFDGRVFKPHAESERPGFMRKYGLKGPYILFVGSLFPYKNVKTLVRSFLSMKGAVPHDLLIVGSREVSREPLPEDSRIRYMDYIDAADLSRFYSHADMLVHPAFFEGFGMTALEAMACGTPVISSNGGSLPEVVGDAGLLFHPEDDRALCGLIARVAEDRGLRDELIKKGFDRVKRFSWEKTAAGILMSCEKAAAE